MTELKKNKEVKWLLIALLFVLFVTASPYFILGENSWINIHDNLDGEFVNYVMLKQQGLLISLNGDQIVPNLLGGLPLKTFHSEFNIIRLFFQWFSPFWAYVLIMITVRVVGFLGMSLLIKRYVLREHSIAWAIIIGVIFSLIPIYPLYGISVLGQPLVIWAFLNLRESQREHKWISWLIVILFPFFSHLALIGPFILCALFCLELYLSKLKIRAIRKRSMYVLFILCSVYILANIMTIGGFINPPFEGHRTEFLQAYVPIKSLLEQSYFTFTNGQYHSSSFNFKLIYLVSFPVIIVLFIQKTGFKRMLVVLLTIVFISLFEGFYSGLSYALKDKFHFLSEFEFRRFTFLLPLLLFVLLSFSIHYWLSKSKLLVSFILFALFFSIVKNNAEISNNWKNVVSKAHRSNDESFDVFFAKEQFDKIRTECGIRLKEDKVICLGFYPSIAQYNGFTTLDGYENNYPLEYKKKFRRIIQKELNKSASLKDYYDNWGSRCYLMSAELFNKDRFQCYKKTALVVSNLDIDTEVLKNMQCKFILSAVRINNAKSLKLRLKYDNNSIKSLWHIFVYEIE